MWTQNWWAVVQSFAASFHFWVEKRQLSNQRFGLKRAKHTQNFHCLKSLHQNLLLAIYVEISNPARVIIKCNIINPYLTQCIECHADCFAKQNCHSQEFQTLIKRCNDCRRHSASETVTTRWGKRSTQAAARASWEWRATAGWERLGTRSRRPVEALWRHIQMIHMKNSNNREQFFIDF